MKPVMTETIDEVGATTSGNDSETDFFDEIEEELTDEAKSEWLEKASMQIALPKVALEAIDRCIGLEDEEVLVCETTCLDYAVHALAAGDGIRELWLVPPRLAYGELSPELLDAFEQKLRECQGECLGLLEKHPRVFMGLNASVPNHPFKLLITDKYEWNPLYLTLEYPLENPYWDGMLGVEGATGAVIYPHVDDLHDDGPAFPTHHAEGAYYSEGFVNAIELPGGHVMLARGKLAGTIRMEDLTDTDNPWVRDVSAMTPVVNGGCMVPSVIRTGIEVIEEATLGDLSARISRGTALSEKKLDIKEKWQCREAYDDFMRLYSEERLDHTPPLSWFLAEDDDLYYVDGSCFSHGLILPTIIKSMPAGQERYIVDSYDGDVLLVSRNSKKAAIYRAVHPTLIGNSVFVINLHPNVDPEYLSCWLRGSFAQAWMSNGGRLLTKGVLASVPVPILDDDVMEQTMRYDRSIDDKILGLRREIARLKAIDRFNPIEAVKQRGIIADDDAFGDSIPF